MTFVAVVVTVLLAAGAALTVIRIVHAFGSAAERQLISGEQPT